MAAHPAPGGSVWPSLRVASWTGTRDTLHMWLQIIGKIRMVETPLINHWWNVSFFVSPRGLVTGAMPYRGRAFDAEFDFIDHVLTFRTSDGRRDAASFSMSTRIAWPGSSRPSHVPTSDNRHAMTCLLRS